ncbi:OmpA family protein [Mesonia sp. K7]|uniref:OmpA family protein n=1 Tax=Mesonia sp. K7 TaxID=2218606 RepID=UPI000DAA5BD6|nr:OmpA family protein [Mesonia sp. K7]PZD77267.1 hypothetical protein DNG35_09350 [Mesonia sp. K7]
MKNLLFTITLIFAVNLISTAQIFDVDKIKFKKFYTLKDKTEIFIPLGNVAFADTIIKFREGKPEAEDIYTNPQAATGEPDFGKYLDNSYVSVGCYGQIVAQFTDNGFIDIDGPDLYFFEIGPSVEEFRVEISADNKRWIDLGVVNGGKSSIDIAKAKIPDNEKEIYFYVRLTDLGSFCTGPTAGSDIDAIATVGGVLRLNVEAHLLFDTDKYDLKPRATSRLEKFIKAISKIPKAEIVISGHTDSDASHEYNIILGKNRAVSVESFLRKRLEEFGEYTYQIETYGETKPVAENNTDANKQKNRRVEIIVKPDESFYKAPTARKKDSEEKEDQIKEQKEDDD